MLNTSLKHLEREEEFGELLMNHDNVVVCCGGMGPTCVPVYRVLEELQQEYTHVAFRDREFDMSATGLPFILYFKNRQVVAATTSIQSKAQIRKILDAEFGKPAGVTEDSTPSP